MKYKKEQQSEEDILINHWTPEELQQEVDKILYPCGPVYEYKGSKADSIELYRTRLVAFKQEYEKYTTMPIYKEIYKAAYELTFKPEQLQYLLDLAAVSEAIVCIDEQIDFDVMKLAEAIRRLRKVDGFLDISEIKCEDD